MRAARLAMLAVVAALAFVSLRNRYDLVTSVVIVAAGVLLVARLLARFAARRRRAAGR